VKFPSIVCEVAVTFSGRSNPVGNPTIIFPSEGIAFVEVKFTATLFVVPGARLSGVTEVDFNTPRFTGILYSPSTELFNLMLFPLPKPRAKLVLSATNDPEVKDTYELSFVVPSTVP